jgi:hypothetical protein
MTADWSTSQAQEANWHATPLAKLHAVNAHFCCARCVTWQQKASSGMFMLMGIGLLQGGRMTQFMEKMAIGDTIDVKGPLGHFIYKGRGVYSHHGKEGKVKQMSMIAGGTGITPMWQVVQVS